MSNIVRAVMFNIVRAVVSDTAFRPPPLALMGWLDMGDAVSADHRNCRRCCSDVVVRRHVNTRRHWRQLVLNFGGDARSQPVEKRQHSQKEADVRNDDETEDEVDNAQEKSSVYRIRDKTIHSAASAFQLTPRRASILPPEIAVPNTPAKFGPMAW